MIVVVLARVADARGPRSSSASAARELVGDRPLDDDPARRHADLALVQVGAERGGVDGVVEVGVGQHDQRVLTAQLEHDALQVPAGGLGELAAGGRRAGEVDPAHVRVLDELVADRRARLAAVVRDDVQHAAGQARPRRRSRPRAGRRRTATPRTASARRCCRTRAARRSSAPTGSAPRSTARSRRPRRPAGARPSRTRRACRTGGPGRAARRRPPRPAGRGPGTKPIWNMPKPKLQPVSRASHSTTSSRRLSRTSAAFRKIAWRTGGRRLRPVGERRRGGRRPRAGRPRGRRPRRARRRRR